MVSLYHCFGVSNYNAKHEICNEELGVFPDERTLRQDFLQEL